LHHFPIFPCHPCEEDGGDPVIEVEGDDAEDDGGDEADLEGELDFAGAECLAHDLSAVHGDDGEEVEDGPEDIDEDENEEEPSEVGENSGSVLEDAFHGGARVDQWLCFGDEDVVLEGDVKEAGDGGEGESGAWAGGGDEDIFLAGEGFAIEVAEAAEGVEDDGWDECAEATGGHGVAEFVDEDGEESGGDEDGDADPCFGAHGVHGAADDGHDHVEWPLDDDWDSEEVEQGFMHGWFAALAGWVGSGGFGVGGFFWCGFSFGEFEGDFPCFWIEQEVGGEFAAFFRDEAGEEVGFQFGEEFDGLIGGDGAFEDGFGDSHAIFVGGLGHIRAEEGFIRFVDFGGIAVWQGGFADDLIVCEFDRVVAVFVAVEDEADFEGIFIEFERGIEVFTEAGFETGEGSDEALGEEFPGFV